MYISRAFYGDLLIFTLHDHLSFDVAYVFVKNNYVKYLQSIALHLFSNKTFKNKWNLSNQSFHVSQSSLIW